MSPSRKHQSVHCTDSKFRASSFTGGVASWVQEPLIYPPCMKEHAAAEHQQDERRQSGSHVHYDIYTEDMPSWCWASVCPGSVLLWAHIPNTVGSWINMTRGRSLSDINSVQEFANQSIAHSCTTIPMMSSKGKYFYNIVLQTIVTSGTVP